MGNIIPEINVAPLVSDNASPSISGTISVIDFKVLVEIGEESHMAIVDSDGSWSIPQGTFANLGEGVYDIVVKAFLGNVLVAVDKSQNELQIKLPRVIVNLDTAMFNSATPMLRGSISDAESKLELQVKGKKYPGIIDDSGNWQLEQEIQEPLEEGYHVVLIKVSQITDNEFFFHESLLVDLTAPMMVNNSPNDVKVTSQPVLFLKFTEKVYPGEGNLTIYRSSSYKPQTSVLANSHKVRGWGTNQLEINLDAALPFATDFFIGVDNEFAKDEVGNAFAGIEGNSTWQFSVLNTGEPRITKISSTSGSPLLERDSLNITIQFSEAVSLRNGNINFTLETGATDVILSHMPFENQDSIQLSYNIARGDYAPILEVTSVFLQNTATLTSDSTGKKLALNVDTDNRLSAHSEIEVDGIPLDLQVISPEIGSIAFHPGVTYSTNKNLTSGMLTWKSNKDVNGNSAELIEKLRMLSEEELKAGTHTNVGIELDLPSGRIYNLEFSAVSQSSTFTQGWPQITMMPDITKIEIAPKSGRFPLGEHITFRVFPHSFTQLGKDTIIINSIEEGVQWRLKGPGSIENGFFEAKGLGEVEVIAEYRGLSAVAKLIVYQANLNELSNNSGVVNIGENLQLKLAQSNNLVLPNRVNILGDTSLPFGIEPVGTSLQFSGTTEAIEEIRLNLGGKEATKGLQSYASTGNGIWKKVPGKVEAGWLAIQVGENNFSQFVNGVDTLVPSVRILDGNVEAMEGEPIVFAYIAEDNIQNPELKVEICQGGSAKVLLETLEFVSGKHSSWQIPGNYVTGKGLSFSLILSDGNKSAKTPSIGVEVIGNKNWEPEEKLKPDVYQMFSFPAVIPENRVQDVLIPTWGTADRSQWRLYEYNGSFVELTRGRRLNSGKAYWVNMKDEAPVLSLQAGSYKSANLSRNFSIDLHEGWNTLANPYSYPIPVKAILDSNMLAELILYKGVEDEFELMDLADSLLPWQGYLVWNGVKDKLWAEKLVFPWHWSDLNVTAKRTSFLRNTGEYRGTLKLKNSKSSLTFGTFGPRSGIENRLSLNTPAFDKKPDFYFTKESVSKKYLLDFFPQGEKGNHWTLQAELKGQNQVTLNLSLTRDLPAGFNTYIYQSASSKMHEFKGEKLTLKLSHTQLEIQEFVLIIGTEEYAKQLQENLVNGITELNLFPSYPNPFSHQTHIPIKIPTWANFNELDISVEIFSYSGKKIQTLRRGSVTAGTHIFTWSGRDFKGDRVASGTYFCQFRVKGHGSWVQKLILTR